MIMKWLVYGHKGWIGKQVCKILEDINEIVIYGESRADNDIDVENELLKNKPDRVVSLIGRTYGPGYSTIDYLEQKGKLVENVNDNLYAPLVLTLLCKKHGIHYTYLGTGCIFNGYNSGNGYKEDDKPDFFGSGYSTVKGFTDRLLHFYDDSVLNCRIRMPITADDSHRNFIIKIMTYKKICSIPNSMSVLPDLLPLMIDMAKNKVTGTVNLTNPGIITHNEILDMARDIIDPNLEWENFSIEEQDKILSSERSNNMLNTYLLEEMYPHILPIKESVRNILIIMKENNISVNKK